MEVISHLGTYANARKKMDRGDLTQTEFVAHQRIVSSHMRFLATKIGLPDMTAHPHPGDLVEVAHPDGVDLGQATIAKFNEVSKRVEASVRIDYDMEFARYEVR